MKRLALTSLKYFSLLQHWRHVSSWKPRKKQPMRWFHCGLEWQVGRTGHRPVIHYDYYTNNKVMTNYRLIWRERTHKKCLKTDTTVNLNENNQIKDMIWLDPEIPPNPLPLGLTPPSQYYTREKNQNIITSRKEKTTTTKKRDRKKCPSLNLQRSSSFTQIFFNQVFFFYSIYLF